MPKRKKISFLMGEPSKKKYNASTAVRVSLDATDIRASIDAEESQVVSSSGEKSTHGYNVRLNMFNALYDL